MQLQGSLTELKLPDILQLANMSQETGVVEFRNSEGVVGKVVLKDGDVVHAKVGDLTGDEAVYEIAIWFEGQFRVVPMEHEYEHNVSGNLTGLLMESARRLDEWRVLSRKIPSLSYYPVPEDPGTEQRTLTAGEWEILRLVNGKRSIRDIAAATGITPFAASKLVYGLLIQNMVRLSKFPVEDIEELEVPPLVDKLLKLKAVSLVVCGVEFEPKVEMAIQSGMRRLDKDPTDKGAVIDSANTILQEWMAAAGKDQARQLAAQFKAILKGHAES